MATTPSQKASTGGPSSSQRRRHAVEAAKKPRVVFPTLLQPDPEDSVPTMSIADSALLRATLVQSRHSWTHTAFSRFVPEPAARGAGGKKFASELTLAGLCTVCIGPHMFLETKFFNIFNPPPPPPPAIPASTPSTAPNTGTTTPTSIDQVADSPSATPATPPVILGGSPAPERVIELIMARTANMAAEAAAAGTIPESLGTMPMDIDTNVTGASSNKPPAILSQDLTQSLASTALATKDEDQPLALIKTEIQEKAISSSQASSPATPTALSVKGKASAARSQRPRHQVAFEFKENPGVRWLFPHETSLERTGPDGDVPGKISASFFLPTMEEARGGAAGTTHGATAPLVPGPGQATTMVILQATPELWTGLSQAINDSAITYRFMMDKLKHIPPRHYVQYKLPVDFPDEQLHPMGLKKLPDNRVVPLTSLQPSKRKSELAAELQISLAKSKKPKTGQDEQIASKPAAPVKKAPAPTPTPAPAPVTVPASSSSQKKCSYCDSVSTPMWRRGPNGPGTLCNACGVKWKHGKILEDASEKTKAAPKPAVTTPAVPPPATAVVIPAVPATPAATGSVSLTTTAEAAARMHHGFSHTGSGEADGNAGDWSGAEVKAGSKKLLASSRKKDSCASEDSSASDAARSIEGDKGDTKTGKKRSATKAGLSGSPGPRLVPINQIGEKQAGKSAVKKDKEKAKPKTKEKAKEKVKDKEKDKEKGKEAVKDKDTGKEGDKMQDHPSKSEKDQGKEVSSVKGGHGDKDTDKGNSKEPDATGQKPPVKTEETSQSSLSSPSSQETSASISSSATTSPTATTPTSGYATVAAKSTTTASAKATAKSIATKGASTKATATPKTPKSKTTTTSTTTTTPTTAAVKTTVSTATTAGAKLELLRTYAGAAPKYQVTHAAAVSAAHMADDGLSLYATKNLYTNNTATFPLHFPTISIAFGPNNAYYTYPNCAVVLFENHFQIKLIHSGERAEIDVYKEGIEGAEFQVIDVGDGESMIVMKAVLRQHLSRFDKELLNPDKNENSMVFRFRERLDGGGPPVKPLLEQWLTTEIPVAGGKPVIKKP
ncbi:hypothetical protein EC991_001759 [Linnemannia zychae]|nr:hypothetical protein EC991_001759 [Linnemannia zychae]